MSCYYKGDVYAPMRLKSHLHIADITSDIIEEITQVKLNKTYIRLGAIMPDILPNRRRQLHSPCRVFEHYEKEFNRIITKNKKMDRISFIVGLLTHYITDAFCLSHNIYVTNLKKHIQYEYLLDDFKYTYKIPDDMIHTIRISMESFINSDMDMEHYIEKMNKTYLTVINRDDWMENIFLDIEHAIINVSTLLTNFILELRNQNIQALAM